MKYVPLGLIEPHAHLLTAPQKAQLLYKIMSVENLLQSINGDYIHFNRVDRYKDFEYADLHDGEQFPKDRVKNKKVKFQNATDYSLEDYYDKSRSRTYATCFSLEESEYIWKNYGVDNEKGKVCVVFDFEKLRRNLNQLLENESSELIYNDSRLKQIFSLNYGVVKYIDWLDYEGDSCSLPNPIEYTYIKDKKEFSEEKELRISLSAIGIGEYVLKDGSLVKFKDTLHLHFDFRKAFFDQTITQILFRPDLLPDLEFLKDRLQELSIDIQFDERQV